MDEKETKAFFYFLNLSNFLESVEDFFIFIFLGLRIATLLSSLLVDIDYNKMRDLAICGRRYVIWRLWNS